jgi:hypothetical protein
MSMSKATGNRVPEVANPLVRFSNLTVGFGTIPVNTPLTKEEALNFWVKMLQTGDRAPEYKGSLNSVTLQVGVGRHPTLRRGGSSHYLSYQEARFAARDSLGHVHPVTVVELLQSSKLGRTGWE